MLAVIAPGGFVLGEAAVALTMALGFCVSFGLLYVYRATISRLVLELADLLDGAAVNVGIKTIHIFGPLSSGIRALDGAVQEALGYFVKQTERGMVYFWNALTGTVDALSDYLVDLTETVAASMATLAAVTIPNSLLGLERRVADRVGAVASSLAYVRSVAIPRVWGEIGDVRDGLKGLGRDITRLGSRVRRLDRVFTAAGAAAIVMLALKRLGLGWVRCRNVGKVGKRLCGMDTDLLDAALMTGLVFYGTVSIVQFAHELQDLQDEALGAIRSLVREA